MTLDLRVAGLDISTTRIGYAAPDGSLHSIVAEKIPRHATPPQIARRCHQLTNLLIARMRVNPPVPELVVIEGYGFGVNPSSSARLGEIGGVIRDRLFTHGIRFVEIPPSSLKLFGTGKGNADKTLMTHCATSAGGQPANDDEADAWHARRMGRVAHGIEEARADWETNAIAKVICGW